MSRFDLVVIAASAGGVEALRLFFRSLPGDFPVPIVVVLHIHPDSLAVKGLFEGVSPLPLLEVRDREKLVKGRVYFAPPDYHVLLDQPGLCALDPGDREQYVRPCADKLFSSAADIYGERLLGVVFSGAGMDGAHGLQKIGERGGRALVQYPEDAAVSSMPMAAIKLFPGAILFKAEGSGQFLNKMLF